MIDQFSVSIVTALVVVVSGTLFVIETLLRRDDSAGRVWALGFLSAMLTTLLYLVWAWSPDAWWAVAGGNAAFVAGSGLMWLGCRRFNGHSMRIPVVLVLVMSVAAGLSAVLAGPDGGDWAGAAWMFIPLFLVGAAAAVECRRGVLGHATNAATLAFVFGLQSLYYLARTIVFLTLGPESELFSTWFGTLVTSALTVILTITAVVATSVLRANRTGLRGRTDDAGGWAMGGAIVTAPVFASAGERLVATAKRRGERLAVLIVRLEELDYISTAFGMEARDELMAAARASVRAEAPAFALVGEDGVNALAMLTTSESTGDARRLGMSLYRGLFDAFNSVTGGVLPSVGIGIALSDTVGYSAEAMMDAARGASERAASSVASAVLIAEARRSV